jgi:chaperonin cofactor prefoldin
VIAMKNLKVYSVIEKLDINIESLDERKYIVSEILKELDEEIIKNFGSKKISFILEALGTYLIEGKDNR